MSKLIFTKIANKDWVFCDCDGTLVLWGDEDHGIPHDGFPEPNKNLIRALRAWKSLNEFKTLVVWSGEGADHAQWVVQFCQINDITDFVLCKPQIILDDMIGKEEDRWLGKWTQFIEVKTDEA